jgi:hypothetical protein
MRRGNANILFCCRSQSCVLLRIKSRLIVQFLSHSLDASFEGAHRRFDDFNTSTWPTVPPAADGRPSRPSVQHTLPNRRQSTRLGRSVQRAAQAASALVSSQPTIMWCIASEAAVAAAAVGAGEGLCSACAAALQQPPSPALSCKPSVTPGQPTASAQRTILMPRFIIVTLCACPNAWPAPGDVPASQRMQCGCVRAADPTAKCAELRARLPEHEAMRHHVHN